MSHREAQAKYYAANRDEILRRRRERRQRVKHADASMELDWTEYPCHGGAGPFTALTREDIVSARGGL